MATQLTITKGAVSDVAVTVNETEVLVSSQQNILVEVTPAPRQQINIDKGEIGPQGPQGDAATIAVGTTTTGAAGTNASVVNSGTSSDAVFNFTIPRGNQGAQGDTGPQGPKGDTGDTGAGVATGGTTGQVLVKASNTNYDTAWATITGTLSYQGSWNASTNTPSLASSVGTNGYYYVVSVAGSTNLNGITDWVVGDWAIFNGSIWQKIDNTDAVTSVAGRTGAVVLSTSDISGLGTIATQNLNAVDIEGGTIDNTTVGSTTPAAGTFTTLTAQTEVLKGTGQNFLRYSQNFTNGVWSAVSTTATNNTTVAPDGTTTAATLTLNVSSANYFKQNFSVTAGQIYTFSFYALRGTATDFKYSVYNDTGSSEIVVPTSYYTSTNSSTWSRISVTFTAPSGCTNVAVYLSRDSASTGTFFVWGAQVELAQTAGVYLVTTSAAVYGTPTLSFSGVAGIGLQSDGSLYVSPAGTGALQAQATTSTATGGNARGSNAVDWQTARGLASQVANGTVAVISGGQNNTSSGLLTTVSGGFNNNASGNSAFIGGGQYNVASQIRGVVVGGGVNTAAGIYNFVGGGFTNTGTANGAVTTQSGTMNATTAVTLSGSNASIKVGQYITGTSIAADTYVAAISGTSLTLSQAASGSSTSTLSFFTPHGVVVGGGNNQATGSYSFIGGGGDAGTAANRNVASGAWSAVVGGTKNVASGIASFIGGGGSDGANVYQNTASGISSVIGGGANNTASQTFSSVLGGASNNASGYISSVCAGSNNIASGAYSTVYGGISNTTRLINGNTVFGGNNVFAATGSSQVAGLVLVKQTTDATPAVLNSDGGAASTTNQIILPNNAAYHFKGSVIANVTGAANGAAWEISGAIMRGANAASTVLIDTPSVNRVAASSGASAWVVTATADTTNGGLAITVTGAASTTIRWVARLETCEVTF